ncbi:kallikrein-1E2-like [Rhodnius prolixus]|uniref:kallikrein-1E2-like n=1 Tax=Rhodnius prolixus TaxID=13249 RepID=UPI003D18E5BD
MIFTKFYYKITVFLFNFFVLTVKGKEYENRTYAGKEISIYSSPYTVFLTPIGCTGALIHEEWILSAGHCFLGQDISELYAALGASDSKKARYYIKVDTIFFNPHFREVKTLSDLALLARYDMALVKLIRPITLARDVQILELETQDWPNQRRLCKLAGYGINTFSDTKLRSSQFYLSTNCGCVTNYNILCADAFGGGDSPCYGDSGGIVVCDGKGTAITSRGIPHIYCTDKSAAAKELRGQVCGQTNFYYVFTHIRSNFFWLKNFLTKNGASKLTNNCLQFYLILIGLQMGFLLTGLTYLNG